jgi:hypothetical protein
MNKTNLSVTSYKRKHTTFVTAYYDLCKYENRPECKTREKYYERSKGILTRNINLIVFCEEETNEHILKYRSNFLDKTTIINIPLFELPFYNKYYDEFVRVKKIYKLNLNEVKDTVLASVIWFSKITFIEKSIKINPYNSTHFVWIDFGITHVAKNYEIIDTWNDLIYDKIRIMVCDYMSIYDDPKTFFKTSRTNLVFAGLWSGDIKHLQKFTELVEDKMKLMFSEDWYHLEEQIFALILRDNEDIHDIYYGPCEHIICNYVRPLHNNDIMWNNFIKFKNEKNKNMLLHITKYILSNATSEDLKILSKI